MIAIGEVLGIRVNCLFSILIGVLVSTTTGVAEESVSAFQFGLVQDDTERFMDFYDSIQLDSYQEKVKKEALTSLPAPCCSNNSAYTCCCECNMARTIWGLSHFLIAQLDYDSERVKKTVEEWVERINPSEFSGHACYNGGCGRAFHKDGCGGMSPEKIIAD